MSSTYVYDLTMKDVSSPYTQAQKGTLRRILSKIDAGIATDVAAMFDWPIDDNEATLAKISKVRTTLEKLTNLYKTKYTSINKLREYYLSKKFMEEHDTPALQPVPTPNPVFGAPAPQLVPPTNPVFNTPAPQPVPPTNPVFNTLAHQPMLSIQTMVTMYEDLSQKMAALNLKLASLEARNATLETENTNFIARIADLNLEKEILKR